MPVFEVQVVIPTTIQADSVDEAKQLAMQKVIFDRKDLLLRMLDTLEVKQISMF